MDVVEVVADGRREEVRNAAAAGVEFAGTDAAELLDGLVVVGGDEGAPLRVLGDDLDVRR